MYLLDISSAGEIKSPVPQCIPSAVDQANGG